MMKSMKRKRKNRPENGTRTTTSPLVVQAPTDWPVRRYGSKCASHTSSPCLRKGERGVVRGNPLALRRRAIPGSLKRLSPVGWILVKLIVSAHIVSSSFPVRLLIPSSLMMAWKKQTECQIASEHEKLQDLCLENAMLGRRKYRQNLDLAPFPPNMTPIDSSLRK